MTKREVCECPPSPIICVWLTLSFIDVAASDFCCDNLPVPRCGEWMFIEECHVDSDAVGYTQTRLCLPPYIQPRRQGKVDAFRTVGAQIVARVITKGKRDHEFTFVLHTPMEWNPIVRQKMRRRNLGLAS
jgi:hypothetical protein